MAVAPCFPEPATLDPRPGLRRETRAGFLRRSTWNRAVEIRAFYNDALASFPADCRDQLCKRLIAEDTQAPDFELIVGRFLQLRGAKELECEPSGGRRRVDWRATFPDGVLHVEAMVPAYNAAMGIEARRHDRLLDVIEDRAPEGWWLFPMRLPALSESSSLRAFTRLVEELLAQLPPGDTLAPETFLDLAGRLPGSGRRHDVRISALRTNAGAGGLGSGAMMTYSDDSERRIAAAWEDRRKRSQGRSVPPPAILALQGGFTGADLESFESALFGTDVRRGGVASGVMATDPDPPWAGVLAFPRVSPAGADDPVLFLSPLYYGPLPPSVGRLEVRRLSPRGVAIQPALDTNVMAGMRWAAMVR